MRKLLHRAYLLAALLACGIGAIAVGGPPSPTAVIAVSVTLDPPPTADRISLGTPGPITGGTVTFYITFSEGVTNFDAASDLLIGATGTVAHTGVVIAGGPRVYTVKIMGITGDGTLALAVNTAADIQDAAGNHVASSVTSSLVTINNGPIQMPLAYWPIALLLTAAALIALRKTKTPH